MTTIFKVRDKSTGAYWNGDHRWSKFNDTGKDWKKKEKAEAAIGYYINWAKRYKSSDLTDLTSKWEVVSFNISYTENEAFSIEDYIYHQSIRERLISIDNNLGYFYDTMTNKKVIDKIEFILKLKKPVDSWRVDMNQVIEARAQLRQLGVKTRTFREYRGMFGMMDRDQAMKARLVLDVDEFIDLRKIREAAK